MFNNINFEMILKLAAVILGLFDENIRKILHTFRQCVHFLKLSKFAFFSSKEVLL